MKIHIEQIKERVRVANKSSSVGNFAHLARPVVENDVASLLAYLEHANEVIRHYRDLCSECHGKWSFDAILDRHVGVVVPKANCITCQPARMYLSSWERPHDKD